MQKIFFNEKKFVNPYVLIDDLSKKLSKNNIIVADDGGHLTWTIQAFKVKYGQKTFFQLLETHQWAMLCLQA